MIAEVPVTLVDSDTVACWGGPDLTITNGHPIVYIRMNKVDPTQPETCGYVLFEIASHSSSSAFTSIFPASSPSFCHLPPPCSDTAASDMPRKWIEP